MKALVDIMEDTEAGAGRVSAAKEILDRVLGRVPNVNVNFDNAEYDEAAEIFKDVINKFKYMNGFSVPRKGGWDTHGLPVEVQVEKKLGLKSKKEVIEYGMGKFIKECRESVFSNIKDWEESTKELGYWIDLEKSLQTIR